MVDFLCWGSLFYTEDFPSNQEWRIWHANTDGTHYELPTPVGVEPNSGPFNGDVAVGSSGGTKFIACFLYSSDFSTIDLWVTNVVPPTSSSDWSKVDYGYTTTTMPWLATDGSTMIFAAEVSSGVWRTFTSVDGGQTWTSEPTAEVERTLSDGSSGGTNPVEVHTYSNGRWCRFNQITSFPWRFEWSDDLVTWTTPSGVPDPISNSGFQSGHHVVYCGNNVFLQTTQGAEHPMVSTDNGATWQVAIQNGTEGSSGFFFPAIASTNGVGHVWGEVAGEVGNQALAVTNASGTWEYTAGPIEAPNACSPFTHLEWLPRPTPLSKIINGSVFTAQGQSVLFTSDNLATYTAIRIGTCTTNTFDEVVPEVDLYGVSYAFTLDTAISPLRLQQHDGRVNERLGGTQLAQARSSQSNPRRIPNKNTYY